MSISLASEDQGLSSRRRPRGVSCPHLTPYCDHLLFSLSSHLPSFSPSSPSFSSSLHSSLANASLDVAQAPTLGVTPYLLPSLTPTFPLSASSVTSKQTPDSTPFTTRSLQGGWAGPEPQPPPLAPPAALAPPFVGALEAQGAGEIGVRLRRSQHPRRQNPPRHHPSPEENAKCLPVGTISPVASQLLVSSHSLPRSLGSGLAGLRHGPASGLCSKISPPPAPHPLTSRDRSPQHTPQNNLFAYVFLVMLY